MTMRLTLLPRPPLAIAAFVLLVATLPAQAQSVLVEKRWIELSPQGGAFHESILDGQDVDRDGVPDIVALTPQRPQVLYAAGGLGVYSGFSGVRFAEVYGQVLYGQLGLHLAWVDDVDGDGRPDVAASRPGNGLFLVDRPEVQIRSSASGRLLSQIIAPGRFQMDTIHAVSGIGDVDLDGSGDVAVLHAIPYVVGIYSGRTGSLLRAVRVPPGSKMIAGEDLDLDGVADFVVQSNIGSVDHVHAYSGATGALIWSRPVPVGYYVRDDLAWMGDRDGDGRSEVLVGLYFSQSMPPWVSGMAVVLRGVDGTTQASVTGGTHGFAYELDTVGDVDGDSVRDFVVTDIYADRSYLYSGATMQVLADLPLGHLILSVGDLDQDGRDEFLCDRGFSSRVHVWGMADFRLHTTEPLNYTSYGLIEPTKIDVLGATPQTGVAIVRGTIYGSGPISLPGCGSTAIPLVNPQVLTTVTTDAAGAARFETPISGLPAGTRLIAVDLATCRLTNVLY